MESSSRSAEDHAAHAAESVWVARLARFGVCVRGLLYVLLAYLAVRVAFGQRGREADREGALHTIAREPFGRFILIVVAAGCAGYALWQLSVALVGGSARAGSDRPGRRLVAVFNTVLYAFICFTAGAIAAGASGTAAGGAGGGNAQEVDWTAKLMHHAAGRVAVGVIGAALIVGGIIVCWRTIAGHREIGIRPMDRGPREAVEALGVVGMTARALIVGAAGVFFLQAAIDLNPRKARGLDGTLKSFAHTPAGPWLLVLVALGLLAFGLYSFAEARYGEL